MLLGKYVTRVKWKSVKNVKENTKARKDLAKCLQTSQCEKKI